MKFAGIEVEDFDRTSCFASPASVDHGIAQRFPFHLSTFFLALFVKSIDIWLFNSGEA